MHLLLDKYDAPSFQLLIVTDEAGTLRALDYADYEQRMHRLLRLHYGQYQLQHGSAKGRITEVLDAYFAGEIGAFSNIRVETGGTQFQKDVWHALRQIPAGETRSYGQLAQAVGSPGASRAVGAANGSNPIAIVVPCHRVIGSNGMLTGYAGGLERKHWLLNHERRFTPSPARALSSAMA
jgi:O-6-methylguanine DNA methyltransferase